MLCRVLCLGLMVTALLCSCGGGATTTPAPQNSEHWHSPPFGNINIAADGSYLTLEHNGYQQVYSKDLRLISEFELQEATGTNANYINKPVSPTDFSGYSIYTAASDNNDYHSRHNEAYLSRLDGTGGVDWRILLDPAHGLYFDDIEVNADNTVFITGSSVIQAVSDSGELLWRQESPVGFSGSCHLEVADGQLYIWGGYRIETYSLDGDYLNGFNLSDVVNNFRSGMQYRVAKRDGLPLTMLTASEVITFNSGLEEIDRYAVPGTINVRTNLDEAVLSADGKLYFLRHAADSPMTFTTEDDLHWLTGVDITTGTKGMFVELPAGDWCSILTVRPDGNVIIANRDYYWDSLTAYSPAGSQVFHRELEHAANNLSGLIPGPAGVAYYESAPDPSHTGHGWTDRMLVAIDLDGNTVGTAVSDKGYWEMTITPPNPLLCYD